MNILVSGVRGNERAPFLCNFGRVVEVAENLQAIRQAVEEREGSLTLLLGSAIPNEQMEAICLDLRVRFVSHPLAIVCLVSGDTRVVSPGLLMAGADQVLSDKCTKEELGGVLTSVRRQVQFWSDLQNVCRELQVQATTDSLTGLRNRPEILRVLDRELNRMHRHQSSLSVLMIDVDHFKRINDTFGHLTGDEVLRSIGHLLQRSVRCYDEIGRYGGEEFIAILPETDLNQALIVAERIRNEVASSGIRFQDQDLNVTISLGVVSSCGVNDTAEQLIERADLALYAAKQAGRNCVCGFPNEMPAEPALLVSR